MSNHSDQKIDRLTLNQAKLYLSAFALTASAAIFVFYKPMFIVEAFFVYQLVVRYVAYYRIRTESHFIETFWTAPVKLLVAAVMIAGIPNDNVWGLVWIGATLMFALSGLKGLYNVLRVTKAKYENTARFESMVTATQRKKESKVEDALFADLAEFLNRPDSDGK